MTRDSRWRRPILAAILLFAVVLGARGWRDNASVMLGGDMARYLMNGVFVHDFVVDGAATSMEGLTRYAELYYAKYPALSLGHHPPLPYVTLVPFYFVFGISIFGVRIAELCWFLLAAWGLYTVARQMFGWQVASWATVLFVTNPLVLRNGQRLLSEMPMLALVLVSMALLLSYCETRRPWRLVAFALTVVLSLYAKQLAAFMLPVYFVVLGDHFGWRTLFSRRAIWLWSIAGILAVPLVLMTVGLAPDNVRVAIRQVTRLVTFARQRSVLTILYEIITTHVSLPLLLACIGGLISLAARRDRQLRILIAWFVSCVAGTVVFGGIEPARYAYGVMPAYFLSAASIVATVRGAFWRAAALTVLVGCVGWQVWLTRYVKPTGAGGYEAAAEYVTQNAHQPTVLLDSAVDTGYFVFFMRAHDPERRFVILRADKLFGPADRPAASDAGTVAAPSVNLPAVEETLGRFGVEFVVVEEGPKRPPVIQRLHDELKTDRFVERVRIPVVTQEPLGQGITLVVYQLKDARPADPDATLTINLPLGGRQILVRMGDLTAPRSR